jgi:hypothetical protein
VVRKTPKIIK